MSASVLNMARKQARKILKSQGQPITLTDPEGLTVETIGFSTKHWINFDTEGNPMDTKNAHICIDENDLKEKNYPVRKNNEVHLRNHLVLTKDSTNELKTYQISRWFPDETIGLIVCILEDYAE